MVELLLKIMQIECITFTAYSRIVHSPTDKKCANSYSTELHRCLCIRMDVYTNSCPFCMG